ncbi:MAG: carbohydrate porin [Bacteroidaceae bacterium]|nr:carbohydrate porin [Bacteroidaceae bacterium]
MVKRLLTTIIIATSALAASAQEFGVQYITEVQTDFEKSTNWMNFLRLDASLNIGKRGSIDFASIHTFKTLDRPVADDWQVFSNITNDNLAFGLAVLGYTHQFCDKFKLFAGVRNVNEDYFISDGTGLFVNSSHGIYPTIAENYPLGNYPLSTLGIHANWTLNDNWTVQGSLYNGVARQLFGPDHGLLDIRKDDGILLMGDVNYHHDSKLPGTYFAGVSYSNKIHGEEMTEDKTNFAYWVYGEQSIYKSGDSHVDLMAQFSQNLSVDFGCKRYMGAGVLLYNILTDKIDNTFGINVNNADYDFGDETVLEATYSLQLTDHIGIQPAYQRIWNDGGSHNAALLRLNIEF